MTLCQEASIVQAGPYHARAVTLKCRAWSCENCRSMRVKQLIAEIIAGRPERMLTLTMKPDPSSNPDDQAKVLAANWRRLIRLIRKEFPHVKHSYFAVFEAHKSGWPHLHIALRGCFLKWEWLRDRWQELTGSNGVDIRFIHNPRDCAAYVAKYMGKDSHRFGKSKRYWKTQDWQIDADEPPQADERFGRRFDIIPTPLADLAIQWSKVYRHVWWEDDSVVRGPEPPPGVRAMRQAIDRAASWG